MVNEGIYYSSLSGSEFEFMRAFMCKNRKYPAHFYGKDIYGVLKIFLIENQSKWSYSKESNKYLVIPKDMLVWKDQ